MQKLGSMMKLTAMALAMTVILTHAFMVTAQPKALDDMMNSAVLDVESDSNTSHFIPAKIKRSPRIEKLHQARKAGDDALVRQMRMEMRQPQTTGEAECEVVTFPSTSMGGAGDLKLELTGEPIDFPNAPALNPTFGTDKRVRSGNLNDKEYYIDMASDSQGNLYVVWQDSQDPNEYLQVYMSSDGGETWTSFGYVFNAIHDLKTPSIAVGEDANGDGKLFLAYIVDDQAGVPYPEVAVSPLPPFPVSFTTYSVPLYSTWDGWSNPTIITDAHKYTPYWAYLICEGVYDAATENINIVTWNCSDEGATWLDQTVAFGNFDDHQWDSPDITFGTTQDRVVIVAHNMDDDGLYVRTSDDYGANWNSENLIYTYDSPGPHWNADPQIAAAVYHDNVMICSENYLMATDRQIIGHIYSQSAGDTWTGMYSMNGSSTYWEGSVALTANEGGGHWHLAWTTSPEGAVIYNWRPQDLSSIWQNKPYVINDNASASYDYSVKGIASDWDTDVACIAWSDYADGIPDYDCFVDQAKNHGLMSDRAALWASQGGMVIFYINSGVENAGRYYALFASATGTSPGTPLPGGQATLPIVWDPITDIVLSNANVSVMFLNFISQTDYSGSATSIFNLPPIPGYSDISLYFAYAHNNPFDYASNPVRIKIM